MITAKYYTVTKHLALTNHVCIVVPLVASKRKVDALPPDLQNILKQEARAVLPFWRSLSAQAIAKSIQFLKSNGVATTDIRYPAFHKTVEPVYAMLQSKLSGDLIDRVVRATNA
jgi:TRAP-type transport system periplasmic protein